VWTDVPALWTYPQLLPGVLGEAASAPQAPHAHPAYGSAAWGDASALRPRAQPSEHVVPWSDAAALWAEAQALARSAAGGSAVQGEASSVWTPSQLLARSAEGSAFRQDFSALQTQPGRANGRLPWRDDDTLLAQLLSHTQSAEGREGKDREQDSALRSLLLRLRALAPAGFASKDAEPAADFIARVKDNLAVWVLISVAIVAGAVLLRRKFVLEG